MRKVLMVLVCTGALGVAGTAAPSSVLVFDDVATSLGSAPMPAGYGGFSWENFYVADANYPSFFNTGFRTGAVTPPRIPPRTASLHRPSAARATRP